MTLAYTEQRKKYILTQFLNIISCVADKEYQKRVWIRAEGLEVDDFTETVCHFFDDGDPILKKYKEYKITEEQHQLLVQLREEFESFVEGDRPYLPEDLYCSPLRDWTFLRSFLNC